LFVFNTFLVLSTYKVETGVFNTSTPIFSIARKALASDSPLFVFNTILVLSTFEVETGVLNTSTPIFSIARKALACALITKLIFATAFTAGPKIVVTSGKIGLHGIPTDFDSPRVLRIGRFNAAHLYFWLWCQKTTGCRDHCFHQDNKDENIWTHRTEEGAGRNKIHCSTTDKDTDEVEAREECVREDCHPELKTMYKLPLTFDFLYI
jgi:hypothetical protein